MWIKQTLLNSYKHTPLEVNAVVHPFGVGTSLSVGLRRGQVHLHQVVGNTA